MRFGLDETQAMIRDAVAAFTRDQVLQQAMAWNEGHKLHEVPARLRDLGELGLLGVLAPESKDGAGMGAVELAVVLQELAKADAGLAAAAAVHNVGGVATLLEDEQADDETVRALASGALIGCAGDPDGIVIGAAHADVLVTGPAPTGVIKLAELEVQGEPTLGLRTCGSARVSGEIAASTGAHRALGTTTALLRLSTAAIAVGIGRRALQAGVQYTLERRQFGKPIARFQALQWMTADAATELEATSLLVHKAAWLHDAGKPFEDAAARAYHVAIRHARSITDKALQMHGGYGYTEDFPVERLYRDAYSLHALAGRSDTARIEVATALSR